MEEDKRAKFLESLRLDVNSGNTGLNLISPVSGNKASNGNNGGFGNSHMGLPDLSVDDR